jgi:hypothetical protein
MNVDSAHVRGLNIDSYNIHVQTINIGTQR